MRKILFSVIATLSLAAPAFAAPVFFDYANLEWNGSVNTGFLPTDGIGCTAGDLCSSNVDHNIRNGDLTYTLSGITALATGTYYGNVAAVVQDHENDYNNFKQIGAGLGVYHVSNDNSDDNVTSHEVLTITFNQMVNLSEIDLRSDGHDTSWISGATFLFDGSNTTLNGSISGLNIVGNTFTFAYGGTKADQFYLGGMTVTAVPEPEIYAMMGIGLALMGFVARRRKGQDAAA